MSHELRTPLTSIAGALDIVLSGYAGALSERQLRYVDMARQAATRMNQLVDQLLDLARAQAGSITVATTPVQLDRLVREVIDRYHDVAIAKQVTIELDASASDISILGDPERLQQIVWNLLSNAVKFTPEGGRVELRMESDSERVRIIVSDSGEGIEPEFLPYVFDRFRQADTSVTRRFGGLGLGLSLVKQLTELHGGTISAASEGSGRGATFVLTLPRLASQSATSTPPQPSTLAGGEVRTDNAIPLDAAPSWKAPGSPSRSTAAT